VLLRFVAMFFMKSSNSARVSRRPAVGVDSGHITPTNSSTLDASDSAVRTNESHRNVLLSMEIFFNTSPVFVEVKIHFVGTPCSTTI
jgi:hypothetical protein